MNCSKAASTTTAAQQKRAIVRIAQRRHVSRNASLHFDEDMTFGQRLADKVAGVGRLLDLRVRLRPVPAGVGGAQFADPAGEARFDPYPYIFLNLILSMLAAVQAPIIMMSQNRQAAKDRAQAEMDYQVNLKAGA